MGLSGEGFQRWDVTNKKVFFVCVHQVNLQWWHGLQRNTSDDLSGQAGACRNRWATRWPRLKPNRTLKVKTSTRKQLEASVDLLVLAKCDPYK